MKISKNTIEILKNFAAINPSIIINPGSKLRTMGEGQSIFAEAEVPEVFTKRFGIYDLNRLLSLLSLDREPEIDEGDGVLHVNHPQRRSVTSIRFTDPKLIPTAPPANQTIVGTYAIEADLAAQDLEFIRRSAAILGTPNIVFVGQNGKLTIQMIDVEGKVVDNGELDLGTTEETFKAVTKVERLTIIPGDYRIGIAKNGILHFQHKTHKSLKYWIPLLQGSSQFT